jgi:hypothetical protein
MVAPPDVVDFRSAVVGGGGAQSVEVDVSTLGVEDTDLVLAFVSWRQQGAITATEDGWTERHEQTTTGGPTLAVYERQGGGGNDAFTFTFSGAASRVCAVVVRVSNASEGVEASAITAGTSTTPTAPDAVAGGGDRLVLRAWTRPLLDALSGLPPDGYTTEWHIASGGAAGGHVDQAAASAPTSAGGPVGTSAVIIGAARNWCAATVIIPRVETAPGRTDLWAWLQDVEREAWT